MQDTIKIMHEELATKKPKDWGKYGDAYEAATRSYLARRRMYGTKQQGVEDIKLTINGKAVKIEIKTACAEIDNAATADLVIYCPNVDPDFPAELQGYVFTREQWTNFLEGYTGRGAFVRWDKARQHGHIQSFYWSETVRPASSKALTRYIESVLFEMPTVSEYFPR